MGLFSPRLVIIDDQSAAVSRSVFVLSCLSPLGFRSHFLYVNKHVSYTILRLSRQNVFYIQRHVMPLFLYRVTTQLVCIYQIRYCRLSGGWTERKWGDVNWVGGPSHVILATSAISLPVECVHKWSRPPLNAVLVFTVLTYCHIVCIHLSPMTACHWISIPSSGIISTKMTSIKME